MADTQHGHQDTSLDILEANVGKVRLQQPLRFRCQVRALGPGIGIRGEFTSNGTDGVQDDFVESAAADLGTQSRRVEDAVGSAVEFVQVVLDELDGCSVR